MPPPPPPHSLTPTAAAKKRCPAGLTASRAFLSAGALFANSRRVPCGERRRPLFGFRGGSRFSFSRSENCLSFYPKRQFSVLQLTLPLVSCACVHLRLFVPRGQQREAVVQRLYVVLRPLLWLSRCCPCGLAGIAVGCYVFGAAHRWLGHNTFFVSAGRKRGRRPGPLPPATAPVFTRHPQKKLGALRRPFTCLPLHCRY